MWWILGISNNVNEGKTQSLLSISGDEVMRWISKIACRKRGNVMWIYEWFFTQSQHPTCHWKSWNHGAAISYLLGITSGEHTPGWKLNAKQCSVRVSSDVFVSYREVHPNRQSHIWCSEAFGLRKKFTEMRKIPLSVRVDKTMRISPVSKQTMIFHPSSPREMLFVRVSLFHLSLFNCQWNVCGDSW